MTYAGFSKRFVANMVDVAVLAPFVVLFFWIDGSSRAAACAAIFPARALFIGYHVYLHGRFGQTVGKRFAGIRVVRIDGSPICWSEAWLRSSVDIALSLVTSVGTLSVLLAIPDAYFALPWMARSRLYVHVEPMWLHLASRAAAIWFWSELAVVLLNRRRRALHDFLAGTVVVTEAGEVSVLPVNHYP